MHYALLPGYLLCGDSIRERCLQTPTQGAGTSSASGSTVSRFTTFVKTMDGDTLVTTDNKQYDLSGVTVITKSDNHTTGSKAVEMVFINGTLNQVIVH